MKEAEQLDIAISAILRVLTIDERRLSANITPIHLNPLDLEVLSYLDRHPGSPARDIASFLGVGPTTMQSVIDRLNGRGFLKRDTVALKGRAIALSLTECGVHVWEQIHRQNLKNCKQMLQCISENERMRFIEHMTEIATQIS